MSDNVALVQRFYGAIGSGDVPSALEMMADDVILTAQGPSTIPFAGTFRGREGVARFFRAIAGAADIEAFEPQRFIADEDHVVVVGQERLRAKATGRAWETGWAMVWTIREGRIAELREFHETHAIAAALA